MYKTISGADYAEYFEWEDSNENIDRYGYFVTLESNKIKIANSTDYILGAISTNPSIIGSFCENNKFNPDLLDDLGRPVYGNQEITYTEYEWKDVEETYTDENGETHTHTVKKYVPVEKTEITYRILPNPNYNPSAQRETDPAWAVVGMLGQLRVRDDGTCQPNGYCTVKDGGIATMTNDSSKGWRVMSRISENVIRILFK